MSEELRLRYGILDKKLTELRQLIRVYDYLTPINRQAEKDRCLAFFAKDRPCNPLFEYRPLPPLPLDKLRRYADCLANTKDPVEELFLRVAIDLLGEVEILVERSGERMSVVTSREFGEVDDGVAKDAEAILAMSSERDIEEVFDADIVAGWLSDIVKRLNLPWRIAIYRDMSARIAIDLHQPTLKIRNDASFSKNNVRRLIAHEIGTHVFRAANGSIQPLKLFYWGFPGALQTEEGLAVYNEEQLGLLDHGTTRIYAGRLLAGRMSLRYGFWQVFLALTDHFGPGTAFEIAARAKRGLIDTSEPGAFLKDTIYFKGWRLVRKYLSENPRDIDLLYTGKIGLQHLPLIREFADRGLLEPPMFSPRSIADLVRMNGPASAAP